MAPWPLGGRRPPPDTHEGGSHNVAYGNVTDIGTLNIPPSSRNENKRGGMAKQDFSKRNMPESSNSKDFTAGHCMTCDSLVRWPKKVKVFKCTICLTINDTVENNDALESILPSGTDTAKRGDQGTEKLDKSLNTNSRKSGKVPPISLTQTKQIIRKCLQDYLSRRLCTRRPPQDEDGGLDRQLPFHLKQLSGTSYHRSRVSDGAEKPLLKEQDFNSCIPRFNFEQPPSLRPVPSQKTETSTRSYSSSYPEPSSIGERTSDSAFDAAERLVSRGVKDDPNRIFKALEDYIVMCFRSFQCINNSFMLESLKATNRRGSDVPRRKPVAPRESRSGEAYPTSPEQDIEGTNVPINELDPRLLMLGDFAENGFWWTGGKVDSVAAKSSTSSVQHQQSSKTYAVSKPLQMNWVELSDWYQLVVNVGKDWFSVFEEISRSPSFNQTTEQELQTIESNILTAQAHTQRLLLKATEALLKRPGRPISSANELRFLIILLENPLLHPSRDIFDGIFQRNGMQLDAQASDGRWQTNSATASGPVSGQHSGIIKRIVGLLSNSSTECHTQLTAWWTKYDAQRFIRLKDFISSFLTYRLVRNREKKQTPKAEASDFTAGLIPQMQRGRTGAYIHDEIGTSRTLKKAKDNSKMVTYSEDWQVKACARVLALIYAANEGTTRREISQTKRSILPITDFYVSMVDYADLLADFDSWESKKSKFCFCQYPFLMSIWAKTQILEHDARRQMFTKARDAFLNSIMSRRNIDQYLFLDVRRECLVEDSLAAVSEVIGTGGEDIKKGLRIKFRGEEGIDGGGLRKEWFLLLVREVFNPDHGLFLYDDDSQYCYFNPNTFETSDQFFLVGVVIGLAIYNSTILDVPLPPFIFRKLLASAPAYGIGIGSQPMSTMRYSLADLAEYKPALAKGLQQLLDFEGDVDTTFALDFVVDVEKYGTTSRVPLCPGGERKAVTNSNRREYVDLYVRYLLDVAVKRQYEPFKRGFYTVCGGNAFSLFRAQEIELLVRGSDEALDVGSLRSAAKYDNWNVLQPDKTEPIISWFWDSFEEAEPSAQRRMLSFITGSDRIPATGASSLSIKISCLGDDCGRYPIARTCFNQLSLWRYSSREKLEYVLWRAVLESEGFGLK